MAKRKSLDKGISLLGLLGLCIGLIILVFDFHFAFYKITETTETLTVTDKYVKNGNDRSIYLIQTDKGVYEITDTWVYFRWDSSDLYGAIEVGETYECKVCGKRIPFLSWYKNIITAEPVKEE